MKPALLSRTLHKWLALIFGLQILLWSVSGFYMVVVDLDFIHGDPLVHNLRAPLATQAPVVPFAEISQLYPGMTQIALRTLPGLDEPVYEASAPGRKVLLLATSGRPLSPLSKGMIRTLARHYYAGGGQLVWIDSIQSDPPSEIQGRALPLWRADFDDWLETSLYIHPDTGMLVTRRHRLWRWFDFLWMLHIMDYDTRTDVNNGLLRVITVVASVAVLSGVWLLYFSFRRKQATRA